VTTHNPVEEVAETTAAAVAKRAAKAVLADGEEETETLVVPLVPGSVTVAALHPSGRLIVVVTAADLSAHLTVAAIAAGLSGRLTEVVIVADLEETETEDMGEIGTEDLEETETEDMVETGAPIEIVDQTAVASAALGATVTRAVTEAEEASGEKKVVEEEGTPGEKKAEEAAGTAGEKRAEEEEEKVEVIHLIQN
jgi:hypothetical protein